MIDSCLKILLAQKCLICFVFYTDEVISVVPFCLLKEAKHKTQMILMAPSWKVLTQRVFFPKMLTKHVLKDACKACFTLSTKKVIFRLMWSLISTDRTLIGFADHMTNFHFRPLIVSKLTFDQIPGYKDATAMELIVQTTFTATLWRSSPQFVPQGILQDDWQ